MLDVPKFDCVVGRGSRDLVPAEFKLRVGQFSIVPYERAHAVPRPDVPYFGCVVKGRGQDLVSLSVETDCDNFLLMTPQFLDETIERYSKLAMGWVECLN